MTQNHMQQWAMVIVPFNPWILLTEMYASLKQAREQYKDQDMDWPTNLVLIPGNINNLHKSNKTASEASCSMGSVGSFLGGKVARA